MHAQAVFLKLSLLYLLAVAANSLASWCNLTSSNNNVAGTASHSFLCTLQGYSISTTNSYMLVAYSSNWVVSSYSKGAAGDFCETGCTIGSVTATNTGNSIKVTGLIPTAVTLGSFSLRYTLGNLFNPPFKSTESITVSFYTSADVLIVTNTVSLNINPAMMTCSATATTPTVSSSSSYTFTVTPGVTLPNNGYMKMAFPSAWRNSLSGPAFSFTGCGGTVSCVQSSNTFTVSNLVASASSSPFSFTFNSLNNPGTEETNNDLIFTYFYANNSQISYCTVPITGLSSPALSAIAFSISENVGTLTYTNVLTPLSSDELLITLPAEVSISQFLTADVYHGSSISPLSPPPRIITGTNQISIAPYVSSIIINTKILLNSLYFLKPAVTANPTFALRRGVNRYSYSSCCSLTQSSTQTITLLVTLTNYMLKTAANYMITFTPTYYAIDYLILDFGAAFSFSIGTNYPCYMAMITTSSQMVCTATTSTQITAALSPAGSFASLLGFASSYTLVITGLTNPSQVTASLTLSSYYLPSNQLEYSSAVTVNYIATKIPNVAITTSSSQVGATATYTFAINNTNSLLANSILHIYFPLSFTLAAVTCTTDSVSSTCNLVNSSYLQFSLPNAAIASTSLTAYTLSVLNVVNPNSLLPTPSFGLELQSGTAVVEAIHDGVVVKMAMLAHFTTLTATPNTYNVGNLAIYTIAFTHSLTIASTSVITLSFQLPSGLILASCTACTSFQTFTITPSTTSVTISGIYNPEQITVATNIVVSLSIDGYQSIQDSAPSITYTALTTAWSLKTDSVYLGDPVKLNFTIQSFPLNAQFFVVTIPSSYGLGAVTTSTEGSMACSCTRTLAVLNCSVSSVASINVTLIVSGLTNPTLASSSPWQIQVYAATAILISAESSSIQFNAPCGTNCRECVSAISCLSCYSNSLVNNEPYLSKSSKQCVNSCGSSEFLQGTICYACSSSCLTCAVFSANCTSCASGSFLYGGNCVSSCPTAYYPSGQTCSACINHCATCSSSAVCISCSLSYILQADSSCQANCPSGQFNRSNVCTACPNDCLTCDSLGCLSCTASYLLTTFTSPSCVTACPTDTFISASGLLCEACQTPCLTCSTYSSSCTACQAASGFPFLSSSSCLPGCPGQTYADELNQCQSCQSPCLDCLNRNQCTSCASPLLYYAPTSQCLTACFSNTIDISGTCQQCVSPCLTCSGTITTCSSCIENYFLTGTICDTSCTAPYVADGSVCSLCYSPCLTCAASTPYSCLTCINAYLLLSTTCYAVCPSGSYASSATSCSLCSPPCQQCSGSATTCTSCFPGSYLFSSNCYSPCPPTYYPINTTCEPCEPQCVSCSHTAGNECSACTSPTYYYNPINYYCTLSCTPPYYAKAAAMICQLCQLPCKSCSGVSTTCSGCYSGYFLKSQQCLTSCGSGFYSNNTDNTCGQCAISCATCDMQKCFTCTPTAYFYDGMCYNVCPAQAPNIYGIYCRNCLKTDCIKCNSQGACTLCMPTTYSFNGDCLASCPDDYEADLATNSQCVQRADIAYFHYIKALESSKIWIAPSSCLLLLSLPLLYFANSKFYCFSFILAVPQMLSLIELTGNYIHQWELLSLPILPFELMFIMLGVHMLSSVLYTLITKRHLDRQQSFAKWVEYGSNRFRYHLVIVCSCFSKQALFILFSGLFNLPFTSFRFKPFKWFYLLHASSLLVEVAMLVIAFLLAIYEGTAQYNNKLFYSSLDVLIVYSVSLLFQISFMVLLEKQPAVETYSKFVLPNVSNKTLPALSIQNDSLPQEVTHNNLHRSGSDEEMLESEQMKDVKFMSEFDPDDYFDETPHMALEKVPEAVNDGKFRKKEKKKRGQRRLGRLNLDIIDQEEEEVEEKAAAKKKKKSGKREDVGGLKNYLYWKKPTEKKANPGLVFKEHENQIMSRIREKESEFDSITQNDIIFQDEVEESSSNDSSNIQGDSRRILHRPSYDNYFNLNYASKKHLGDV